MHDRLFAERARQVAEKLNLDNVEVLESTEGLTGKKATSKGWFDPKTGKITVVVPNHGSTTDITETVLHALSGDIYEGVQRARAFREAEEGLERQKEIIQS